jgi:hypothetical protein
MTVALGEVGGMAAAPVIVMDPGAAEALADAAAVVDAVVSPVAADPYIGPGGDREAALMRMRELNAGTAQLALEKRAAAPPAEPKPQTAEQGARANLDRGMRRLGIANLVGVLGLTAELGPQLPAILEAADKMQVDPRVAVHSAAQRMGIIIEGLFSRS